MINIIKKKLGLHHIHNELQRLRDIIIFGLTKNINDTHKNPLNKFGKKCFSQADEDGITLEIIKRLKIEKGLFCELGVGNGLENNSLILASLGWQGFWIGNESLGFNYKKTNNFLFLKDFISLENLNSNIEKCLKHFDNKKIDVVSVDLDGNDYYIVNELLSKKIEPKLFIVEYNAKFPPPVEFKIQYNKEHKYNGDDYYGASLSSFAKLFEKYEYKLVCCNASTGANAFFVKSKYIDIFRDVPTDINDIYVEPRYFNLFHRHGHTNHASPKVIENIFNSNV